MRPSLTKAFSAVASQSSGCTGQSFEVLGGEQLAAEMLELVEVESIEVGVAVGAEGDEVEGFEFI
jgi:hypothetical protein